MNISEMHETFRVLGQQQGLQLIRGILPESIDTYLNDAILEWTRKTIQANVETVYKDKVTLQNNSINPINGVRTLYKRYILNAVEVKNEIEVEMIKTSDNKCYEANLAALKDDVLYYTSFELTFDAIKKNIWCRFVDRDKLMNTINDYCNGASKEYPIICMHEDGDEDVAEIYLGEDFNDVKIVNGEEIDINFPKTLIVNYVGMPNIVKWDEDMEKCVNCNLPQFCHYEIVELAVNKFFQSIGSTNRQVS